MDTDVRTTTPATGASDWERHTQQDKELVKGLGLTSATMLVMGSMIGSGIFIVSAEISREVQSPALLIGAWAITGFLTIVGALSYGELAAMMPRAGGQYVYLRESLGPLWGFLYGWTLFLVIQTGTIAAVGVAFGKFLGIFWPAIASSNWILHLWKVPKFAIGPMMLGGMDVGLNTQNLVAILVVIVLSSHQYLRRQDRRADPERFHDRESFRAARTRSYSEFSSAVTPRQSRSNFGSNFWKNSGLGTLHDVGAGVLVSTLTALAIAQVGSLFSADAWNNVTFTAGEVKNPSRNFPLSLALGTGVVIALYISCNFIYLGALPLWGSPTGTTLFQRGIQYASEDRVATAVMTQMFGAAGGGLMAVAIMISGFGCCNGLILSGARVYYAMAKDGLFFRSVAKLHPEYKTPVVSLMVQMIWTASSASLEL